jgi:hypothetical protein
MEAPGSRIVGKAILAAKKTYNNGISPLRCAFEFGYTDHPELPNPADGLDSLRITRKDRPKVAPEFTTDLPPTPAQRSVSIGFRREMHGGKGGTRTRPLAAVRLRKRDGLPTRFHMPFYRWPIVVYVTAVVGVWVAGLNDTPKPAALAVAAALRRTCRARRSSILSREIVRAAALSLDRRGPPRMVDNKS